MHPASPISRQLLSLIFAVIASPLAWACGAPHGQSESGWASDAAAVRNDAEIGANGDYACRLDAGSVCAAPSPSYAEVAPILKQCVSCHSSMGGYGAVFNARKSILSVVSRCEMRPSTQAEWETLRDWLACGASLDGGVVPESAGEPAETSGEPFPDGVGGVDAAPSATKDAENGIEGSILAIEDAGNGAGGSSLVAEDAGSGAGGSAPPLAADAATGSDVSVHEDCELADAVSLPDGTQPIEAYPLSDVSEFVDGCASLETGDGGSTPEACDIADVAPLE